MRLFSLIRRGSAPSPATVRPNLESLDGRVMPALLSLSAPVSAFAAVRVAPIACTSPALNADFCIAINVNASVGRSCAPTSCLPTSCAPKPCTPPIHLSNTVDKVAHSLGNLVQNVGRQAATDLRAVGGLLNGVARQAAMDVNCATSVVGDIISGIGCRPYSLAC